MENSLNEVSLGIGLKIKRTKRKVMFTCNFSRKIIKLQADEELE